MVAILSACQLPILDESIAGHVPECAAAPDWIAVLEAERVDDRQRVASGIKSIVPVSAVVHLFRGEYGRELAMASGEYNRLLDERIAAIRNGCDG